MLQRLLHGHHGRWTLLETLQFGRHVPARMAMRDDLGRGRSGVRVHGPELAVPSVQYRRGLRARAMGAEHLPTARPGRGLLRRGLLDHRTMHRGVPVRHRRKRWQHGERVQTRRVGPLPLHRLVRGPELPDRLLHDRRPDGVPCAAHLQPRVRTRGRPRGVRRSGQRLRWAGRRYLRR